MSERRLDVWVDDDRVGRLRAEDDLWAFDYDPAWSTNPRGFDLSPALPRQQQTHADGAARRPVQWYFDNLLPEEALRTVLAKEARVAAEDAFGLLAWFGAESAGSLVLLPPGHETRQAAGLRPLVPGDLQSRIGRLSRHSLSHDAPKRMSLAGAQHKMVLVMRGSELYEPLPGTPSTHILKPDHASDDYPASVANEHFTMRLAAALGIKVPRVHRLYVPAPVYIVERFDRTVHETGTVERHHIIDTCQLLDKSRSFKYVAAQLDTLAQAIAHCRAKAAARRQLYRWLLFSMLVGNADNHLKNVSFRVTAQGVDVAPAYDLLSTAVYETRAMAPDTARWPAVSLAIPMADATRFDQVSRAGLIQAGRMLGLTHETSARELANMVRRLPAEADRVLADVTAESDLAIAQSPDPEAAGLHRAGELRLLRAITRIVIPDMLARATDATGG